MRLNILAWKEEEVRPTMQGMQFKLMDFETGKHKWMTIDEIKEICEKDGSSGTKIFRGYMSKWERRAEEVKKIMEASGFEKNYLKRYSDGKTCTAEIVEFRYGNITSAPRLLKTLAYGDFFYQSPGWGVEDEILVDAKNLGVVDIYLIDEYNNWHFYTTMNKMNLLGESMHWGKTYLALKHFKVYKYSDRTPNYQKFMKGIDIHENTRAD